MRRAPARLGLPLALLLVVTLAACSEQRDPGREPGSLPELSPSPPVSAPSSTPAPAPPAPTESLPPVTHRRSLAALMREDWQAGRIRYGDVIEQTATYTRYAVTYGSGSVTVSGVLLRPRGRGPFPGVVLNHGYIEPSVYVTGQGLAREQVWLAEAGFAVLHTDYRGHAGSDPAGDLERETRLGYTRDSVHAVLALEREPYVDPDRMAMLGRSMGGGVTLNALVAYPDLVEAAVIYASVSSSYLDNLRHFTRPNRPDAVRALYAEFGTPRQSPDFYAGLSARTHFDRIDVPVLMHHGTDDETCPFPWARETERRLLRAGVDARLDVYPGERHSFEPQWQESIERTVRFLRRRLG